ncbi:MAG: hypothetical protein SGJ27_06705 [Candidatus Melainabacteria bacterium]|nr:hypothetical protein [Candidatus Melainabacteria bacterium]
MKPNLGLSIVMGVIFSIFITSIYILMSTVPSLVGAAPAPTNPLGEALTVFIVLSVMFSFIMQEIQGMFEALNQRNRSDQDPDRKDEGAEQNGDIDPN